MGFHPPQHAFACGIACKLDRALLYLETAAVTDHCRPVTVSVANNVGLLGLTIWSSCLYFAVERRGLMKQAARGIETSHIFLRERKGSLEMQRVAEFRKVRADGWQVDSMRGFRGKH